MLYPHENQVQGQKGKAPDDRTDASMPDKMWIFCRRLQWEI